ncbi:MAG: ABC transporter ATP-binding protein [Ruminococcaceae bacterium]|nr:ABC transporter ATP-binding protein [Oscillospiraceae bacterium]
MFADKKNQKEKPTDLVEAVKRTLPGACPEEALCLFGFHLDPHDPEKRCDGIFYADRNMVRLIVDGQVTCQVPLAEISEMKTDNGVGCIYVSYQRKSDQAVILLCRSDMSTSRQIIHSLKLFNHYLEDGKELRSRGNDNGGVNRCPKCGRPYRPGSNMCLHCASKKKVIKRLWNVAKPYKGFMITSIVLFFAVSGLNLILPYINKILVDEYIKSENPHNILLVSFVTVILSMLGVTLLIRGVSMLRSHLLIVASNRMIVDLRNMLFEKIQKLSISKISQRTAGDLMNRVSGDTGQVQNFLVHYLPSLLEQLLLFLAVGGVILAYDYRLFLLIMLPTPLVVLSFNLFWRFMRRLYHRRWQCSAKSNAVLHDIFSGIRVVKAFGMERRETERFDKAAVDERNMTEKADCLWSILMPILQFFMSFGEFIILYYVGSKILGGEMTLGEMSQFSAYVGMIYGPLRMVAGIPRHVMHFLTSSNKVFEILDEQIEIADREQSVDRPIKGDIDINGISFGYESGGEVLHKIDLHIKSGEFIGLVGKSGTGKSTLINLIMRMYDVEDGSICVDGIDIRDYSQEALRSQMGVVLQETFLFSGTIYQNIAYAKPMASRDEIIAVSKLAGCHEFIIKMPDGYNTKVGEKGYSLSGGERQRVAIARALLHNPRILILDEATASLDTETEKQIQDALANLSANRTTIAIAHRLSTLRNATKLVVLDNGRVAEIGTHDELVEKKGIYYGLVMAQREMSKMEVEV